MTKSNGRTCNNTVDPALQSTVPSIDLTTEKGMAEFQDILDNTIVYSRQLNGPVPNFSLIDSIVAYGTYIVEERPNLKHHNPVAIWIFPTDDSRIVIYYSYSGPLRYKKDTVAYRLA